MIEKSDYVFVVADSSKFQEKGLLQFVLGKKSMVLLRIIASHKKYMKIKSKGFLFILGKKE